MRDQEIELKYKRPVYVLNEAGEWERRGWAYLPIDFIPVEVLPVEIKPETGRKQRKTHDGGHS